MPLSPIDRKIADGTYRELAEGLSGGCDDRGEFEIKKYLTSWADRSNFIREAKGTSRTSGGIGAHWTTRIPYQLPDNPRLYARDIVFEPVGELIAGVTPIAWTHAAMTVTFRQPDFNFQAADDPGFYNSLSQDPGENAALLYATQELDFGKEWLTLPNSSVKFKSDGKLINSPQGRSVTVITMQITWHRYPVMPMALMRDYADSVNNARFLNCEKGTVFFEGPKTTREAAEDGTVTQKVQQTFRWRKYDWNMKLREDGITWDLVVDKSYGGGPAGDSDSACNYAYKDFSKLLLTR